MSRIEKVDFNSVVDNLSDTVYDYLDYFRDIQNENLNNDDINFPELKLYDGVYSGYLLLEEHIAYLTINNPNVKKKNKESHEYILSLLNRIKMKVESYLKKTTTETSFMKGQLLVICKFRNNLVELIDAMEKNDFEKFHVACRNLVPDLQGLDSENIFNDVIYEIEKEVEKI